MPRIHKPLAEGTKIHRWTVIERSPNIRHELYYKCQCECGFISSAVKYSKLIRGLSKSCGCLIGETQKKLNTGRKKRRLDSPNEFDLRFGKWEYYEDKKNTAGRKIDYSILGKCFGSLKVISYSRSQKKKNGGVRTLWNCLCEVCGETKEIIRENLLSGNSSTCGCRRGIQRKVSEASGYSPPTVSLVLNNKNIHKYTPETIDRIRRKAKELGYYARKF